jgi:hypothetical protein
MPVIDVLASEAAFLELILKLKEKKLRRAAKLIEQAEAEVAEAINSIVMRTELDPTELRGAPRLLRDAEGRPAKLVWRDAPNPKPATAGSVVTRSHAESTEVKT